MPFVTLEHQIQHRKSRYKSGDCNGNADFEEIKISEFEVVLFEDGAPHNACEGADGREAGAKIRANNGGIYCCFCRTARKNRGIQNTHRNVIDKIRCKEGRHAIAPNRSGCIKQVVEPFGHTVCVE